MLNFLISIPKVNSNLTAVNVKEELRDIHVIYTVTLKNPFHSFDWQREKNFSMAAFDVHNGLMSAFDRDIEERRVTLCALAWPRGFFCHS